MRSALLVVALLTLSGCAEFQQAPGVIAQPSRDWRAVATESDRLRLREWRSAFVDALRSARAGGHSADVAREGVLLDTERDVAGFVERIGPNRWRLIMPRPHFESQMDVMELVPSSQKAR